MKKRISYVALINEGKHNERAVGPYLSFKKAEGFAKAWNGCVLILEKESDFLKEEKSNG